MQTTTMNQQQLEIHAWEANVNIPCVPSHGEVPVDGDLVMCPLDNVSDLKTLEVDTASASNVLEATIKYAGPTQRLVGVCYVANSKLALDGYTDNTSPAAMTVAITGVTTPWNLSLFPWNPCDKLIVGPAAINETTGAPMYPMKDRADNATLWPANPYLWDGDLVDGIGGRMPIDQFAKLAKSSAPFTLMPLYARVAIKSIKDGSNFDDDITDAMFEYDTKPTNETMRSRLANGDAWARAYLLQEWEYIEAKKMSPVDILEAYFMMVRCLKEFYSIVHTLPGSRGRVKLRL